MSGKKGILAFGIGFGMLVVVTVLLSSVSLTHATEPVPAIKAWVDYDCEDCEWTDGDHVLIFYKETLQEPDPVDPDYNVPILYTPGGWKAHQPCVIDTGYYKVTYHMGDCGWLKKPKGWKYMDCSQDLVWWNYCQEDHP